MKWLRIYGNPVRQFYSNADALPFLQAGQARHELLLEAGTVRSNFEGETSNVTVTLRNSVGQCSRLFARPPLTAAAELYDGATLIFAGSVQLVDLDSTCRVTVEA